MLDSTVKALVADLVPPSRRATAYGVFAAVQGAAAIAGGVMAGALYERSLPILIAAVIITQIIALVLLIATLRHHQRSKKNSMAQPVIPQASPSLRQTAQLHLATSR